VKVFKAIWFFISISVMSCSNTPSDNVKTDGFYVTYKITGNNVNTATCKVTFQVGGATGTYLDLSSNDVVTCDGQSMSRSEFAGIITYSVNVAYQVGKTYNVVLTRSGEDPYNASVTLPEAITGYSPSVPTTYQKGSSIAPTWTPSSNGADAMSVSLSYSSTNGSRLSGKTDSAPENGNGVVFDASDTQMTPAVPGPWSGTITFTRNRTGNVGTLSGSIRAEQEVSVVVNLID
jgi:hypothetical protein